MATAPTPGVGRRDETAKATKRILVIKLAWTGDTYRLAVNNVPVDQRAVVLKQTGISYNAILTSGDDMLITAVAVWMSRRLRGEASLSWQQFQRHWPAEVNEDDVEVWAEDPAGNKLDEDGNVIDDDSGEPPEVDDPES